MIAILAEIVKAQGYGIWIGRREQSDPLVEGFPGEIEAVSVAKPSLEDVFIRRTGHRFWTQRKSSGDSAERQ